MQHHGTARRVRVKGKPGVYVRPGTKPPVYEISFSDSAGRRRWKTIDGGLREAVALRDELRSRVRRGERVAPSRMTFAELAETWFAGKTQLRRGTRDNYRSALDRHLLPRFGRRRIGDVSEDEIARMIAELQDQGYAAWTIRGVLTPLGGALQHAVRRGYIGSNAVRRLERGERPAPGALRMRILDRDEIGALLGVAPARYRTLIAFSIFAGPRQGEALGLIWADVDFEAGIVRIRKQLARGERVEPKTPQAIRDVIIAPSLVRLLREHKVSSPYSQPSDFVFASLTGTGLDGRNVRKRGLAPAVQAAGLDYDGQPRLRWHDLRHTAASLLIAQGLDVVFVSRQLGHASPEITLKRYAHLFDAARHAERARSVLEAEFGSMLI